MPEAPILTGSTSNSMYPRGKMVIDGKAETSASSWRGAHAQRFTFVDRYLGFAADEGDRSHPIHCGWRVCPRRCIRLFQKLRGCCPSPKNGSATRADSDYPLSSGTRGQESRSRTLTPHFLRRAVMVKNCRWLSVYTGTFALHSAGLTRVTEP